MSRYELEYIPDTKTTIEAMKLAGGTVFKGPSKLLLWAHVLVAGLLVPAGFLALVLFVEISFTGNVSLWHPLWYVAIFVVAGAAGMLLTHGTYWVTAKAAGASRFGRHVRLSISAEEFVFAGGKSEWRMAWSDVDAIVKGKRAIVVCTGAVALPVPIDAFETQDIAMTAFNQMVQWHDEAVR